MKHTIKLTFFKPRGKYYSNAEFDVELADDTPLFQIWDIVKYMRESGDVRTGLMSGGIDFFCVIDVPTHTNNHPHMLRSASDPAKENDFTQRELATILAALRYYQAENLAGPGESTLNTKADGDQACHDIATNGGKLKSLSAAEVDVLCERLNFD